MSQFKELTIEEALDLFRSNSAFRGDMSDWLIKGPAAEYAS